MSRFLAALVTLVALVAAILVLAPQLIPAKAYKPQVEAAATKALGRKVTLGDKISFKLLPNAAFAVTDLVVANADGFEGAPLASVAKADIGVKLAPLFSRRVEISRFVLTDPALSFEKAADGRVNWSLGAGAPAESPDAAAPLPEISLGDVRVINGRATYKDGAANKTYAASAMNLTARLASLNEPFELAGDMMFQGAPSTVSVVLTTLADIVAKEPANLKLDLNLGGATVGADLQLAGGDALAYSGPVKLNAPNLPALAKLFDVKLEEAPGFDTLTASGEATGQATRLSLADATITFDAIDAAGDLALDWSAAKPKATGALDVGSLDLRPYLPPPAPPGSAFPPWSTARLDLSSLRNLDANIDLVADKVFLNDIETGETRMKLTIAGGRMIADMSELTLWGGDGSGRLIVNATGATPSFAGDFILGKAQAQPFSIDMLKHDRLLGVGAFTFDFQAAGASQAAIMSSLDGKGGFDLADGALKGVNIAKLAGAVAKLYEGGGVNPAAISAAIAEAQRPDQQTDFSKFLSKFTIADGVVNTPTIAMEGPYLSMTGAGVVNLPGQKMDIRLAPRASTSADGKQGRAVAIPVKVGGTFAKPTIGVDLETLLRARAENAVKGFLNKALGGKSGADGADKPSTTDSILKGVLGGGAQPSTDAAGEEDAAGAIAGEALKGLFGRKKAPAPEETAPAEEPN